ncbi:MAG: NUDIX hydrolase [Saprospiraceae bacterium]|nr:NUDIX hydrolase [Saprospiraceae bacterium]
MYKIYINETPLILAETLEVAQFQNTDRTLVARYLGKPKFLFHYIDMLEKAKRFDSVTLYADDLDQLFADFTSQYKIIEAAGGVVVNSNGEALLIFRRDFWDLPKGKIDPGETVEAAAVREVQEETGLQQLILKNKLTETYHTYKEQKKRILKRTYWFEMETTEMDLTPQTEEDIEIAVWQDITYFLSDNPTIYASIREVLTEFLQKNSKI